MERSKTLYSVVSSAVKAERELDKKRKLDPELERLYEIEIEDRRQSRKIETLGTVGNLCLNAIGIGARIALGYKALIFEQTGAVTSFTAKTILSDILRFR